MACNLQNHKLDTLSVGRVVRTDKEVTVQLVRPPSSCPDGYLHRPDIEIRVQAHAYPTLIFDAVANHPVVTVPSKEYIEDARSSNLGTYLFFVLAVVVVAGLVWLIRQEKPKDKGGRGQSPPNPGPGGSGRVEAEHKDDYVFEELKPGEKIKVPTPPTGSAEAFASSLDGRVRNSGMRPQAPAPASQSSTTIINNPGHSGVGDFATGMMLGSMMSGGHGHSERIVEREVIREEPRSNHSETPKSSDADFSSKDDDNSDSSSSSESGGGYESSSDSGSDYSSSSDSGSDYSSSSGSDFSSSDSGGFDSGGFDSGGGGDFSS